MTDIFEDGAVGLRFYPLHRKIRDNSNDKWYRCYGKLLNICNLCILKFNCWTEQRTIFDGYNEWTGITLDFELGNYDHNSTAKLIEYMFNNKVRTSLDEKKPKLLSGLFIFRNLNFGAQDMLLLME
jgi:hypothetical protein